MRKLVLAGALAFHAAAVLAHGFQVGSLTIAHPYARPSAPAQPNGAAYLKLVNKGAADRLVGATSPLAASVQLHSMRMEGDVMRMRELSAIDVPAGATLELKPGGLHLMLIGLKAPLLVGQSVPLKLTFQTAGDVDVELKVDAPAAAEMRHEKAH